MVGIDPREPKINRNETNETERTHKNKRTHRTTQNGGNIKTERRYQNEISITYIATTQIKNSHCQRYDVDILESVDKRF